MMNKPLKHISLLLLVLLSTLPVHAQLVVTEHADAELVAETIAVFPGQQLWVALRLDHEENWHTYWKNPGDAGKATEIAWNLPQGVSAGDIVWPTPERFELPADLVDFGYEEEIFLLTLLSFSDDFQATSLDTSFTTTADVSWLICEDICIPGGATLTLTLPVLAEGPATIDERWAGGFARTRASFPRDDIELDSMFSIVDGSINLLVQATESIFENARDITFIPDQHRILDYNAEQQIIFQLSSMQLSQLHHRRVLREPPQRVGGLLLVTDAQGQQIAYQVDAEPEGVTLAALDGLDIAVDADMSLFLVFAFALLGGMILNLMPCVFPVISLKVMSLTAGHDSARERRLHGLVYAAGVIGAFIILAALLLTLQAGGAAIGWGFHLQSPVFVAILCYLFFLMALSMSGVIEIGTGIMGLGSELGEKEGYKGSFFTGVLATVVASPCTAPFMGAALGFALTQPMLVALTVFAALGFGMALPFLILAFVPALLKFMPRPGHWMVTFKQILAIPLYATVIWLLWVISLQTSFETVALIFGSSVILGLAFWIHAKSFEILTRGNGWANTAVFILALGFTFGILSSPYLDTQLQNNGLNGDENYEVYSDARLSELRANGEPVFVNMTAAWCITCLVNEKIALSSDTVIAAMEANNVTYLKGDWTNNDPEITAVLKRYQTSGVPLYLMFPADASLPAEMLPQILTEGIILDALERI